MLSILLLHFIAMCFGNMFPGEHSERYLASANIPEMEMQALYDFYVASNGEYWLCCSKGNNITAWNFTDSSANPCVDNWQGITCILPPPYTSYYVSELQLMDHNVSGTIPWSIGNLSHLNKLNLNGNFLQGLVPSVIGQLSQLTNLDLNANCYSGTIPTFLGNLTKLVGLKIDANLLTGSLPCFLSGLTTLQKVQFAYNYLTGPFSDCLSNLSNLEGIILTGNMLSSTLPSSMAKLGALNEFRSDYNLFSGPIPESIGDMSNLLYYHMTGNALSGSIPSSIGKLTNIIDIYVDLNQLSGPLPDTIGNLEECVLLYVNDNKITGTVPTTIGNMGSISFLILSDNFLGGTMPLSLSNCSALSDIEIVNNAMTGSLVGVFNASNQPFITSVQLYNNHFTGTIPEEIFNLVKLDSFVGGSNCFHGSLPSNICGSVYMKTLVLDGLSSATSCRVEIFPLISTSYILQHSVSGTLPDCLFQLPKMETLHLSGNGFHGSLPTDTKFTDNFNDLTLSHNFFRGSLPENIQARKWANLDVSYNLLSGTLRSDFGSVEIVDKDSDESNTSSISLENNRLSGRIPGFLHGLTDISILGSNLFSCALDASDLPLHDDDKLNYQCGSVEFNIPYYIWLSLFFISQVSFWVLWRSRRHMEFFEIGSLLQTLFKWYNVSDSKSVHNGKRTTFANVGHVLGLISFLTICGTFYIFVVLLPLYAVLTKYNGSYTYEYAYTASAALLSGYWSFDLEFPLWMLLLFMFLASCSHHIGRHDRQLQKVEKNAQLSSLVWLSWYQKLFIYCTYTLINIIFVGGINYFFVYCIINGSRVQLVFAQIFMSIFKLVWNRGAVFYVLRFCGSLVVPKVAALKAFERKFVVMQIRVAILNNVIIPCIAVFCVSPSCFYDVFVAPPEVSSTYATSVCGVLLYDTCVSFGATETQTTTYSPPFSYTYQCSSSLITSYAPAFVSLCVISTFFVPAFEAATLYLLSSVTPGTWWYRLLLSMLPRLLKPLPDEGDLDGNSSGGSKFCYFSANRLFINLSTNLALILTFGVVFPPVALALCATVLTSICLARVELGRFVVLAMDQGKMKLVEIVKKECVAIGSIAVLQSIMWTLISISCLFYTIFLFDTLGDVVGFNHSYWVLIVIPLMPLFLYAAYYLYSTLCMNVYGLPDMRPSATTRKTNFSMFRLSSFVNTTPQDKHSDNGIVRSYSDAIELPDNTHNRFEHNEVHNEILASVQKE